MQNPAPACRSRPRQRPPPAAEWDAVLVPFQESAEPSVVERITSQLQQLGWIDTTALGVLLAFFVLGLFKGFIWQVSRVGILVTAYFAAGWFGPDVAAMLSPPADVPAQMPGQMPALAEPAAGPGETSLYLAYCLLFIAVLIVLSLVTLLVKKLADKAGLSFFDRLGGGVLGVATGACVVLFCVLVVHMFFPQSELARAARGSHSLAFSKRAIDLLGGAVHDDLRGVLELQPLAQPDDGFPSDPLRGPSPEPGSTVQPQPQRYREPSGEPLPAGGSGGCTGGR